MSEMINPYIAGAPISEAGMFFGREDVFNWIQHSLPGRYVDHILVIHGQRRVGKTSVLKQLPHRMPDRYIPVFFDLQGRTHTTLERFLWWLAREIIRVLKQDRDINVPMPKSEDFAEDPDYLESKFLPGLQPRLGDRNLLLTFDEFDSLEETEVRDALARPLIEFLRRLTGYEGLNFVFSIGSSGRKLENMQAAYTEFFKAALYKEISFLDRENTHALITQPVTGILEYGREAVDRIYQITSGHPYFTQLICHELFTRCQRTQELHIHQEDVEAVLEDVVERGTVNLKFVWDEASDLEKWTLAHLAHMEGKRDTRSLEKALKSQRVRFTSQELTSALLHMREKDVLTEDNRFVIDLMRIWLQKNRPLERVREELVEVNPIASRYIDIGLEYKDIGQHEKAIGSFQEALVVDPENLRAQVSIAGVRLEQQAYNEAVVEYEKALAIDEEDVAARAGLCEAHLALGDQALSRERIKDAIRSYQQVLSINAEHTDARQRMADIHKKRAENSINEGRLEAAFGEFKQALQFTPEDQSLEARFVEVQQQHRSQLIDDFKAKAEKARTAKRWDQAIAALEEALELAPDDNSLQQEITAVQQAERDERLGAILDRAKHARQAERWDEAIASFEEYLALEPGDASILESLAEARMQHRQHQLKAHKEHARRMVKAERWDEALASWRSYLKLEPEDREAILQEVQQVELYQKMSQAYDEARKAMAQKDYDNAVNLLKGIVVEDETYKDSSRLMAEAIELRRAARPLWKNKWIWGGIGGIAVIAATFLLARSTLFSPKTPATQTSEMVAAAFETETPAPIPPEEPATSTPLPTPIPLGWTRLSSGQAFSRDNITAIVIDPSDPGVIYVGTENAGVYKSIDSGISWQPVHNGLGRAWIHSIVIDPENPRTVYAGVSTGGVYKTIDGGQLWFEANNGLTDFGWEGAAALAMDPQDSQHLLFTAQNGLYETRNGGERWLNVHKTYPSTCFLDVKFHPKDSQTLFAVARYERQLEGEPCQGGIFRSEDGGQTWEGIGLKGLEVQSDLHQTMAIDQQNGDLLYVITVEGIYGSSNGGNTWQLLNGEYCRSIAVDPDDGNTAYCVSWEGILITTDGWNTWKRIEGIFSYQSGITAIAVSSHDPQTLIYGGRGILVSSDGGETWTERNSGLGTSRLELQLDPLDSSIVYLQDIGDQNLHISVDGGQTWDLISGEGSDLAFDAAGDFIYRFSGGELLRSRDDDQPWERLELPIDTKPWAIAAHPKESQTIYISYGRAYPPHIYYSFDGGNTWESATGMESVCDGRLYFDHDLGDVVYVFGDSDSFRSEDGGETWGRCEWTETWHSRSYSRLAIDPRDSDRLILATRGRGILLSVDGCQSWEYSNMGLDNYFVNTVAIDPDNPDTIYAGTDSGLYISFDGGEHWGEANGGLLGALVVYSIVVDPQDPSNVYAATPYGIFKLETR
jgi:tetratricopeptide (TPR) repeat protein/photosystem II stability/assembly factor-like uncharacterized protein